MGDEILEINNRVAATLSPTALRDFLSQPSLGLLVRARPELEGGVLLLGSPPRRAEGPAEPGQSPLSFLTGSPGKAATGTPLLCASGTGCCRDGVWGRAAVGRRSWSRGTVSPRSCLPHGEGVPAAAVAGHFGERQGDRGRCLGAVDRDGDVEVPGVTRGAGAVSPTPASTSPWSTSHLSPAPHVCS